MSEAKPKKMVSRDVAIALSVICIVLLASLFGVILNYEQQIQANNDATFRMDRSIVYFTNKTINENASWLSPWAFEFSATPEGYFSIDVQSSTNKTYVLVEWSWLNPYYDGVDYGTRQVNYENMTYVGTGGEVNFPVMGGATGGIKLGNNNTNNEATITFSITLYY